MTDKEKVINALELCANGCNDNGCSYLDEQNNKGGLTVCRCIDLLARDVIALLNEQEEEIENLKQTAQSMMEGICLLKEQEARVMTLDEVKAFDWDYCYLEEERLPGKEYRIICGDYALTCITWPCIASMRIQHGDDNYGKKWRCWSAKPTDEQRKAAKWG